jgi:hypothetical protein
MTKKIPNTGEKLYRPNDLHDPASAAKVKRNYNRAEVSSEVVISEPAMKDIRW